MSPYYLSHKIILFDNNYLPKLRHTLSPLSRNLKEHLGGFCCFSIGNNQQEFLIILCIHALLIAHRLAVAYAWDCPNIKIGDMNVTKTLQ